MIAYDRHIMGFKTRTIWLSDSPFDVEGIDSAYFYACRTKVDMPGFLRKDLATIEIDLTKDIDHVWSMLNSKCRSGIRRAEKDGVIIHMDQGHEVFLKLNDEFRTMKGLDHHTFPIAFAKEKGKLFIAEMNGEIISGILFLNDGNTLLGMISASRRMDTENGALRNISNANRLLWWSAIDYAKESGLDQVDMGGYYIGSEPNPQAEGINEFKRRFGGEVIRSYEYRKDYTFKIRMAHLLQRKLANPFAD